MELPEFALEEIEGLCNDFGYELVLHRVALQRKGVFVELVLDKPGGITVNDCGLAAERIGAFLDAAQVFPDGYSLRVSSPGVNRPLVKPEHFVRFVGSLVKLTTNRPVEGRKHFTARLVEFTEGVATLELEDGSHRRYEVPFDNIAKARVQYEWDD